jgi:hypothetical protein
MAIDFFKQYRSAINTGVPLMCIRTFDARSAIEGIKNLKTNTDYHFVIWDIVTGVRALSKGPKDNTVITDIVNKAASDAGFPLEMTSDPNGSIQALVFALRFAEHLPQDSVIFLSNMHLFWGMAPAIQAIWNLRDAFKERGKLLIMLANSGAILPMELASDTLILDEPLPTDETLAGCVTRMFESAKDVNPKIEMPSADVLSQATKALTGLPYFPSEQSIAMCMDVKAGKLDIPALWERKRQAINQTRGLQVLSGNESLDDIGGLHQVKEYLCRVMEGKDAPNLILFMDEVEKSYAGNGTDTSGVTTKLTGAMLEWTEDKQIRGMLSVGVPGVGKSQLAKSIGNKYGKPVIKFNLSDMESGIVGSSQEHLRQAQAMIDSISGGKVFMIATCNSVASLPPELKRRFSAATFFFDAPETQAERNAIWAIYKAKYQLTGETPKDTGWTGAEIKNCAYTAYTLNISLLDAAKYIIPVTVSDAHRIETLRRDSSGKYLSASYDGVYRYDGASVPDTAIVGTGTGKRILRDE